MATLQYVGGTPVNPTDLVDEAYINTLLTENLSQATVDNMINNAYTSYVTTAYVNQQAALLATEAYIDTQNAGLLQIASLGTVNGIAGLQAGGRLPIDIINVASSQRWPDPFVSPTGYNTGIVTAGSTEVQVGPSITVPSPSITNPATYKLFICGTIQAYTAANGTAPVVNVRLGSTTGPIVATGTGLAETYPGGTVTQFTNGGSNTYNAPIWATKLDFIVLGAGGGGAADGGGGGAGHFAVSSTTNVSPAFNITCVSGAGGVGGAGSSDSDGFSGGSSSVSGTGVTTTTGSGGGGGSGDRTSNGASPGTETYDGGTYPGGVGGAGNSTGVGSPGGIGAGGGGGGATGGFFEGYTYYSGGNGGNGSVWIYAQDTSISSQPTGQVTIMPVAFGNQSTIQGSTTLYVMIKNGTATTTRPALWITPFPA